MFYLILQYFTRNFGWEVNIRKEHLYCHLPEYHLFFPPTNVTEESGPTLMLKTVKADQFIAVRTSDNEEDTNNQYLADNVHLFEMGKFRSAERDAYTLSSQVHVFLQDRKIIQCFVDPSLRCQCHVEPYAWTITTAWYWRIT